MKRLLILVLPLLLIGCDKRSIEEKSLEKIESFLTASNKAKLYCFYLGDINIPYSPAITPQHEENRLKIWVNNELNRRLALFTQLELLQKSEIEGQITYSLTDIGQAAYQKKSFCFGDFELQKLNIDLNTQTSDYIDTTLDYKIVNIPEWANSELFKNYFYRHNDENNGLKPYPDIDDSIRTTPISLIKERKNNYFEINWRSYNGISVSYAYDIADSQQVSKIIKEPYFTSLASYVFAYYDFELSKKIFSDSLDQDEIITYWGDPDPIVYQKIDTPDYINRANAMILLDGNEYLVMSKNKIKSVQTKLVSPSFYDRSIANANVNIIFNDDYSLNRFDVFLNSSNIVTADISTKKIVDFDTGKTVWVVFTNSELKYYSLYNKNSVSVYYILDELGQIIGINSKTQPDLNATFIPQYDKQKRLIQYGDTKLIYKNDRLVERIGKDEKIVYSYDKKNQLSKLVRYQLNNGKYIKDKDSICIFTDNSEQGDWTRFQCTGINKSYRQITYFDNEQLTEL